MRAALNVTTGDLDVLRRLADARREVGEIADALIGSRTSKREQRAEFGRRLNAVKASLGTVELRLGEERADRSVERDDVSPSRRANYPEGRPLPDPDFEPEGGYP